jgi:hypothetical protein
VALFVTVEEEKGVRVCTARWQRMFGVVKTASVVWRTYPTHFHVPRDSNVSFRFPNSLIVYCSLPLYTNPLCPLPRSSVGEK